MSIPCVINQTGPPQIKWSRLGAEPLGPGNDLEKFTLVFKWSRLEAEPLGPGNDLDDSMLVIHSLTS